MPRSTTRLLILCACLLALAGPALAAKKKLVAPEPESALSPALAKPVGAALEALESLKEAMLKRGKRTAPAIRKAEATKAELKEQLEKIREARAGEDEAAAKDAAIVATASGLRAADLIAQGLQDDDDEQIEAGQQLGMMAIADLRALDEGGEEAALGGGAGMGGGGAESYEIGPSIGANFSFGSSTGSMSLSTDLSGSVPITRAMDIGAGFNLGLTSREQGNTSSLDLNLGVNGFTRYHFLQAFPSSPWIVPYLGGKLGWSSSDSSSVTSSPFSSSSSSSSGTTLGLQLGSLFFVDQKTAMTLQLETAQTSNSSGTGSSTSSSSLTLSLGIRVMF